MKKDPQKEETFFDKEQEEIYNIITGKLRYAPEPFRQQHLSPDIIFKVKVPNSPYIPRGQYLSLSNFMPSPSYRLERAYARAEKTIADEMQRNRENLDPLNLKTRLQLSLHTREMIQKEVKLINDHEEEELMILECVNELSGVLDCFTVMFNSIVYTLQRHCGFRIKSFVLYGKNTTDRYIYLFLSLATENLLRIANKYRIKKEVEYTHFDFFLNDPSTPDGRPIKLNTKFITDKQNAKQLKHFTRFFSIKQRAAVAEDIIEEVDLGDQELENFRSCNEELHIIYDYLKERRQMKLTNQEKMYLFEYNRRKLNPGVEKYFIIMKKRREFFDLIKQVLPKYKFQAFQQPTVFEEFSLPDKNSKGATFFNKLESILLYKPMTVSRDGKLNLFLDMERTKLSYMLLKQHFKISYLKLIGADILTLDNEFQKFGGKGEVKGGLDGRSLIDSWNSYSLFSDSKVIRNYMGERVAYEILYQNYVIGYMLSVLVPYVILFVLEQVFSQTIWVYTSQAETVLYVVSYSVYMFYWQSAENEFIKNFCDAIPSKMFLSKFRGPYVRNVLTDQVNEFHAPVGWMAYILNLVCFLIIVVLLVILGSIFHGFRLMLVQIFDSLKDYQAGSNTLSLAHIITYGLFFIAEQGYRLLVDKVIAFMVFIRNPPSDEDERQLEDTLTFFYLLAIEMIPPFYLLILEPFNGFSCYADSCDNELTYYIYSRYVFIVGMVLFKLIYILVFRYIRTNLKNLMKSKGPEGVFYQDKLAKILKNAMEEGKKPQHKEDKMNILVNLQNYAIYCTVLPISPAVMFFAVFIHFTNMRLNLLYEERRPLNRSESIIRFSEQIRYIYYLGVIVNSWVNVFLLEFVERNMQSFIEATTTSVNYQAIFLLKFFTAIFYAIILIAVGQIAYALANSFSQDVLKVRKDHKFQEYLHARGGLKHMLKKEAELIPLRSLFRTFNPERHNQELVDDILFEIVQIDKSGSNNEMGGSQMAGSAADLNKEM